MYRSLPITSRRQAIRGGIFHQRSRWLRWQSPQNPQARTLLVVRGLLCAVYVALRFRPRNADNPPQRTRRTSLPTVPACSSPWRLSETNGFPVLKTPPLLALWHRRLPARWLVPHHREPLARSPQDFQLAFFAGDAKGNEGRLLTAASQNADWPLARRCQQSSFSACGRAANANCECSRSTGLRSRPEFCRVSARRTIRPS